MHGSIPYLTLPVSCLRALGSGSGLDTRVGAAQTGEAAKHLSHTRRFVCYVVTLHYHTEGHLADHDHVYKN